MSDDTQVNTPQQKKPEWTVMFFFASDNTLSPSTIPQIKSIKAAGPPVNANVLVYFDPNEKGAPTRVFNINRDPSTGTVDDSGDPVISVLSSDFVSPEEIKKAGEGSKEFAESLEKKDSLVAVDALRQFLNYCREAHPAQHYILFLVGHGLVVGRDAFLPDDNPDSAIGLTTLGGILNDFNTQIGDDSKLELIGMHSCSMSAVEVAYELKDRARYMLGSQGISFVGSWPYRQLLTKIYNDAGKDNVDVDELVKSLHTLTIHHSVDFMHAGYSSDICLCSLAGDRIDALTDPISKLSKALQKGVNEPRCRDFIVMAHWKSQSYWQETFTDLFDFCFCLTRLCKEPRNSELDALPGNREASETRLAIIDACKAVTDVLTPANGGPIVCADYVGPDVQYSHGLSIYFPWSEPLKDENDHVIQNYGTYAFTSTLNQPHAWLTFLDEYFDKTKRFDRLTEEEKFNHDDSEFLSNEYKGLLAEALKSFPFEVAIGNRDFVSTSALEGKITPPDSTGGACTCASTKNHPRKFSLSPLAATVFDNTKPKTAAGAGGPNPSP